jgi:hypothetical protein
VANVNTTNQREGNHVLLELSDIQNERCLHGFMFLKIYKLSFIENMCKNN